MKVCMNTSAGPCKSRCQLPQGALWGLIPDSPMLCPAPGLALMMQLSRELKTLAREFSLAVVVSVAVLCPSCAGCGEEPWGGSGACGRGSQRPEPLSALLPDISAACRCLVPSMGHDLG